MLVVTIYSLNLQFKSIETRMIKVCVFTNILLASFDQRPSI